MPTVSTNRLPATPTASSTDRISTTPDGSATDRLGLENYLLLATGDFLLLTNGFKLAIADTLVTGTPTDRLPVNPT